MQGEGREAGGGRGCCDWCAEEGKVGRHGWVASARDHNREEAFVVMIGRRPLMIEQWLSP